MDEKQFIEKVLIPFLMRAGFCRFRRVHGVDEHGRDLIFFDRDRLGQELACGAQVKMGDVSGQQKARIQNELIPQLLEGKRVPYRDPETGSTYKLSRMYLIISGCLKGGAKEQFHAALEQEPNIFVLDRQSIEFFVDPGDYATTFEVMADNSGTTFYREPKSPPRLPLLGRGTVLEVPVSTNGLKATFVEVWEVRYEPVLRTQHLTLRVPVKMGRPLRHGELEALHASIEEWFDQAAEDLVEFLEKYGPEGLW